MYMRGDRDTVVERLKSFNNFIRLVRLKIR